jgi:hypothetical protein
MFVNKFISQPKASLYDSASNSNQPDWSKKELGRCHEEIASLGAMNDGLQRLMIRKAHFRPGQ